MKRLFAVVLTIGLICSTGVYANDGKQFYNDFRCAGCHGTDGKGAGANAKGNKPIAGIQSHVTHESIMKAISGSSATHPPDSCNAVPTEEQVKAIADYVASLPK